MTISEPAQLAERAVNEALKASRRNAPRLFYSPLGVFSHHIH